jgi:hypothetical protein
VRATCNMKTLVPPRTVKFFIMSFMTNFVSGHNIQKLSGHTNFLKMGFLNNYNVHDSR